MNSKGSANHITYEHRRRKQNVVTPMATIVRSDSCCNHNQRDAQSNNVNTTLISGDLTTDPLYQILRTPFAKTSEKTKVLKSFMKTDMHIHFAEHSDQAAAQAVLNKLTEEAKEKHGFWGPNDCAAAILKIYYLLKQPGNRGKTHSKEAQRIIGIVAKCEEHLANPSQPAAPVSRVGQGARNHLTPTSSSIRHFSEWEEDWTADPAYLALRTPFIRKSERVSVIKSFINKPLSESFKRNQHRAKEIYDEIKQEVKRDRYWNVHLCATSIIRLHRLLVKDKADEAPPRGIATKVLPSHIQKLMKIYQKCELKSKELQEKKLDGSLKPGCMLEDFDKSVEDRYVESSRNKRTVSLQEMIEKRKRETKLIEECAILMAGLQDNQEDEAKQGSSTSRSTKQQRESCKKKDADANATATSMSPPRRKKLKKTFEDAKRCPVVMASPSRRGAVPLVRQPSAHLYQPPAHQPLAYHPGRVPSALYDPALTPSSWTPALYTAPQKPCFHVAASNEGPRMHDASAHVSPAAADAHSPCPTHYAHETTAGITNSYSGSFRNAPAPPPPSFYNSYAPIMPSFQKNSVASRVLDYALIELAKTKADVVRYERLRMAVGKLTSGDPAVNQVLENLYRGGVVSLEHLVQFILSFGWHEGKRVASVARATF